MSDATGSASVPLSAVVTPTASVAPTAETSDSDAQTPVTFTQQMQQELTDKFLSVGEDRKTINRKLNELHTSTALDSARLQGFSELIDSKLTSHHKSLTRVVEESIHDFIVEVTNYIEERVPEKQLQLVQLVQSPRLIYFVTCLVSMSEIGSTEIALLVCERVQVQGFRITLLIEWIMRIVCSTQRVKGREYTLHTQILVSETPQQCCLVVRLSHYVVFSYNSNGSC
ncbi:TPA: hypothetical protein ACH3X1_002960 [Trebouxia sp. C0004]